MAELAEKVDKGSAVFQYHNDLPGMFNREVRRQVFMFAGMLQSFFEYHGDRMRTEREALVADKARARDQGVPEICERARGWLKFLHAKATSSDLNDWSLDGPGPPEWWDGRTFPPMCSFARFDLHESTYAVLLMADMTPAWREAYTQVMDGLASRYTTHWAAGDFLNQFGDDPKREEYPFMWMRFLVPEETFRAYNAPGWTGNGLGKYPDGRPAGIQADPIEAEGMLFFKGWLLLVMSIYTYVSGDGKYTRPWRMANVAGTSREWTLTSVAEHLQMQWSSRACGLH